MCSGCWGEYLKEGAPSYCEFTHAAVEAVENLYEVHGTGGMLHVVVDDWNCDTSDLVWCISARNSEINKRSMDDLELKCFTILYQLSKVQRATVLAIYYGYVSKDDNKSISHG